MGIEECWEGERLWREDERNILKIHWIYRMRMRQVMTCMTMVSGRVYEQEGITWEVMKATNKWWIDRQQEPMELWQRCWHMEKRQWFIWCTGYVNQYGKRRRCRLDKKYHNFMVGEIEINLETIRNRFEDYRSISLLSMASKVHGKIIVLEQV